MLPRVIRCCIKILLLHTFVLIFTSKPVTKVTMQACLPRILAGKYETAKLEGEFKTDKHKKATSPQTRGSDLDFH